MNSIKLNRLIDKSILPESLLFLESSINSLLNGLSVKDFQFSRSNSGDSLFFSLTIISEEGVGLTIPGLDCRIIVNPAVNGTNVSSSFRISGYYQWHIIRLLKNFKLSSSNPNAIDFLNIIIEELNLYPENILSFIISEFILPDRLSDFDFYKTNPRESITFFVDIVNSELNANITLNNSEPDFTDLYEAIIDISSNIDFNDIIMHYIASSEVKIRKIVDVVLKNTIGKFKDIVVPNYFFQIDDIKIAIEISRDILIPLDPNTNEEMPEPNLAYFSFDAGDLVLNSNDGLFLNNCQNFNLVKSKIASTNLTLEILGIKFDFSKKRNISEAITDGRPTDFIGCYITEGIIGFPANWNHSVDSTAEIKVRNLLIGTGGISGTLSLEAKEGVSGTPIVMLKFGSHFNISLDGFSVSFQQNSIISSSINGTLNIPGFKDSTGADAIVNINVFIGNNGDFSITASEEQTIDALEIPNVLKIRLKSLTIGQKNNRFYAAVSGYLDIIASVPGISIEGLPKNIEVKKLLIWEDGKIEIEGGALTLPKALAVKIGPVKLSLSAIHLGSKEQNGRQYNYFGFDGGVNVNPGGVDVQGNGIKFFYTTDDDLNSTPPKNPHRYLRIESIKVDIRIPGTAKEDKDTTFMLKGSLSMKNAEAPSQNANGTLADPTTEYIGSVTFKSNRLGVSGAVGMRLNPDVPAFLVDAELEFGDKGVMMGSTGLGLFGIRGLVGQKYGLDKSENEDWWQYYKRPVEGINIDKFKQKDGFSLGVGATLGTYNDQGKAFSTKVFLMLGLPDIFLIQGQAAILAEKRLQLGDTADPPFSALISINKDAVRATLGVKMNKPDSGKIARLEGKADLAFFFNNSSGWYVNLGKDTPDSERIKARICDMFDAYAYLMLSKQGIKLGAGAVYETKKEFAGGKVKAELGASIDIKGRLSYKPVQIGGAIDLAGYARISVFKFKLGLSAGAGLAVEASQPFIIAGYLYLDIDVPKPFKDFHIEMDFTTVIDRQKNTNQLPILNITDDNTPGQAINMLTEDRFKLNFYTNTNSNIPAPSSWNNFNNYIIPIDSFIDIDFEYPVKDATSSNISTGNIKILGEVSGKDFVVMIPPQKGILDQVKHTLEIKSLTIKYWDESLNSWQPYNVYDTVPNLKLIPNIISELNNDGNYLKNLPSVFWQLSDSGNTSKIRVMARNMLSHISKSSKGLYVLEENGFTEGVITCEEVKKKGFELEWVGQSGTAYIPLEYNIKNGFVIECDSANANIVSRNPSVSANYGEGLTIDSGNTFSILLPEPCNKVVPKLEADSTATVTISYFELLNNNTSSPSALPVSEFNLVRTDDIAASALNSYSGYEDENVKISKIEVCINASSMMGSIGTNGVLGVNTANLTIGGDGTYAQANCQAVTIDNLVIYYNHPLVSGSTPNTIGYPYPLIASATPVADWQLNNNANDTSGNGFNGLFLGNPRPSDGYNGSPSSSMTFCHSCMQVAHNSALNLNGNQFLVGFWFNSGFSCMQPNKNFVIFEKKDTNGSLYRLSGTYDILAGTESLLFEMREGYGTTNNVLSLKYSGPNLSLNGNPVRIADNQWHYITLFCNKSSQRLEFYIDGEPVNSKNLSKFNTLNTAFPSTDSAWLYSVEAENEQTYRYNLSIPSQQELNEQNEKINELMNVAMQPVWRPNTTFAVQLEMKDSVYDGDTMVTDTSKFYNFGFRTKGPIGHFHEDRIEYQNLLAEKREDEFALASLKPYVNFDRSYPNADGDLLRAKPIYYESPKLNLFFNEAYVYNFFGNWELGSLTDVETKLQLKVNDPEDLLQNANALEGTWVQKNNMIATGEDAEILQNLATNGQKCTPVLLPNYTKVNYAAEYVLPNLKPLKSYTAVYSTILDINSVSSGSQVLSYVFNTSKYANHAEQINSFILYDQNSIVKKALFDIDITLDSSEYNLGIQTITTPNSNPDALKLSYMNVYDRLISGVLKIKDLEIPVSTEVNIIKDTTTDNVIAILVRNPEPFIDPKIKIADLDLNSKPLIADCNQSNPDFKYLYRNDMSAIVITNTTMDMPLGDYDLTFKNLGWDGEKYSAVGNPITINFTI